ncbi:hypothetical protein ACFL59_15115, partial [Planctomycetota bacterium]
LSWLAKLLAKREDTAGAEAMHGRATAVIVRAVGPENPRRMRIVQDHAEFLRELGRVEDADALLDGSVE